MAQIELGEIQEMFANLVWQNEPIVSRDLVKICEKEFNWKRTTTYTVLRKLCDKGLLMNENGVVTSVISRKDFYAAKSEQFVEDTFDGSLPAFFAAFISHKKISPQDAEEIQAMIDTMREG